MNTHQANFEWIKRNPLTRAVPAHEQQLFAEHSELMVIDKGGADFAAEDEATALYLIHSGESYFERSTVDGDRTILNLVFPGDLTGFSGDQYYLGTLRCVAEVVTSRISVKDYQAILEELPVLAGAIKEKLMQHMVWQQNHIYMLGHQKAETRLCYFLNLLKRGAGIEGDTLKIALSRTEIGDFLGLRKETVIRAFRSLSEAKLIAMESDSVVRIIDERIEQRTDFF